MFETLLIGWILSICPLGLSRWMGRCLHILPTFPDVLISAILQGYIHVIVQVVDYTLRLPPAAPVSRGGAPLPLCCLPNCRTSKDTIIIDLLETLGIRLSSSLEVFEEEEEDNSRVSSSTFSKQTLSSIS